MDIPTFNCPDDAFRVLEFKLEWFVGSLPHAWKEYPTSVKSEWTPEGWTHATLETVSGHEQRERLKADARRLLTILPTLRGRFPEEAITCIDETLRRAVGLLCRTSVDAAKLATALADEMRDALGRMLLGDASEAGKQKRSTGRGDARAKIIAALTRHHQYADDSCMDYTSIGVNQLARLAGVSPSTVSDFFSGQFDGYPNYKAACGDGTNLCHALRMLNGEVTPRILFNSLPADTAD